MRNPTSHAVRKAFTLIELLVVIAIIAVLAGILFPVFAQAKMAAKESVTLSNLKQLSLGQLMYAIDANDAYSPSVGFDTTPTIYSFQVIEQPYLKNLGVIMDPIGPLAGKDPSSLNNAVIIQQFGMPPRFQTKCGGCPPIYLEYLNVLPSYASQAGINMTNGQYWVYDGIGGAFSVSWPQNPYYDMGWYVGNAPGMKTSAVGNSSDMVMVAEAGLPDFGWATGFCSPDSWSQWFGDSRNPYGNSDTVCAPMARARPKDPVDSGVVPHSDWYYDSSQPLPSANTIYAATDGHAKSVPWMSLMTKTIPLNDGSGMYAIKALWPH